MIEITNERRFCNCCGSGDRVQEISFWTDHDKVHSGITVALCRACRDKLRYELQKEIIKEMRHELYECGFTEEDYKLNV